MQLILGDCLEELKKLPDNSVDSVVTDPPYGISFMGKKWDYEIPSVDVFKEILRVLKHGGYALIACGTRTQHRMAVNIEDAGFEIRDVITWLYGSGFPKSLDISKAIDKAAGAEREKLGTKYELLGHGKKAHGQAYHADRKREWLDNPEAAAHFVTAPSTDAAKQWQGWGTALKPACEFWTLARKPLAEKTVAKNVLKYGTGGINIDGCRVEASDLEALQKNWDRTQSENQGIASTGIKAIDLRDRAPTGRFPANLILDEEAAALLDLQTGETVTGGKNAWKWDSQGSFGLKGHFNGGYKDTGGASRFFYTAKASKSERNAGCEVNGHPTVKPIKLMRYLCRLITPTGGVVLDPFMGSGSTGLAAKLDCFDFVGIEREPQYFEIAKARVEQYY